MSHFISSLFYSKVQIISIVSLVSSSIGFYTDVRFCANFVLLYAYMPLLLYCKVCASTSFFFPKPSARLHLFGIEFIRQLCYSSFLFSTPLHLYVSTPLRLYTSTPLHLYAATPLRRYTSTPLHLYAATPLRRYTSTPLHLYAATPLRRYTSTPLHLYVSTLLSPSQGGGGYMFP